MTSLSDIRVLHNPESAMSREFIERLNKEHPEVCQLNWYGSSSQEGMRLLVHNLWGFHLDLPHTQPDAEVVPFAMDWKWKYLTDFKLVELPFTDYVDELEKFEIWRNPCLPWVEYTDAQIVNGEYPDEYSRWMGKCECHKGEPYLGPPARSFPSISATAIDGRQLLWDCIETYEDPEWRKLVNELQDAFQQEVAGVSNRFTRKNAKKLTKKLGMLDEERELVEKLLQNMSVPKATDFLKKLKATPRYRDRWRFERLEDCTLENISWSCLPGEVLAGQWVKGNRNEFSKLHGVIETSKSPWYSNKIINKSTRDFLKKYGRTEIDRQINRAVNCVKVRSNDPILINLLQTLRNEKHEVKKTRLNQFIQEWEDLEILREYQVIELTPPSDRMLEADIIELQAY